jgi:eukaryotic-like serine/threonine-protein kinase
LAWEWQRVVPDDSKSVAGVREGDVLAGKYRVERVLGVGGMGVVVAAHHIQLDERVALKFLLPEALGNAEATARFAREARAAVKIKSEHVARVTDVGTLPNGAPYMVMEYLDGGDLAAWLEQRGVLPIGQAVEFVLQACIAVADAHALGIVHRDLKPANLFCVRRSDGQLSIKVLDFGISKMTDTGGVGPPSVTRTAALMGSPLYMSPEQMRSSKNVDAQTDIWALGVILFELMTGRPVFLAGSVTELAIKVANEPAPLVRTFRAEVPSGLEAAISKCLEKDRRARYHNVAELALALLPFAPKRASASVDRISGIIQAAGLSAPVFPPRRSTEGAETISAETISAGTLQPLGRTTGSASRRMAIIGGGVAVTAVAIAGSLVFRARESKQRDETPVAAVPVPIPSPTPTASTDAEARPSLADASPPPTIPISAVPAQPPATPARPTVRPPSHSVGGAPPMAQPTPASPPAHPAHKPNCNPPYVIDSEGDRQYKPECL